MAAYTITSRMDATITPFAMTAVFTPRASCSTLYTYEPMEENMVDNGLLVQHAGTDISNQFCFPPGLRNSGRLAGAQVFSPGYCPMGYTSADRATTQADTTVVCCPSNHEYTTTRISSFNDALFVGCTSMFPSSSSTIVPIGRGDRNIQVTGPITIWALPITIQHQSSDLSLFVSETTATPSDSSSLVSKTSEPSGEESTGPGGLSTQAGIGIGVGVGVVGIALLAAIGLLLLRRHKRNKKNLSVMNTQYHNGEAQMLPSSTSNMYKQPSVSELNAAHMPHLELHAEDRNVVHELSN
ncbi:hypothetical protein FQN57_006962 [Myotisia sp. PD_48]|nr:hypothetical protein FQN57_006962 [Myotisia sp. PD_48]